MVSRNGNSRFDGMQVGSGVLGRASCGGGVSLKARRQSGYAARAISARMVRAAHTNSSAPSMVVRLADNSE
jgi:hypothetical protein